MPHPSITFVPTHCISCSQLQFCVVPPLHSCNSSSTPTLIMYDSIPLLHSRPFQGSHTIQLRPASMPPTCREYSTIALKSILHVFNSSVFKIGHTCTHTHTPIGVRTKHTVTYSRRQNCSGWHGHGRYTFSAREINNSQLCLITLCNKILLTLAILRVNRDVQFSIFQVSGKREDAQTCRVHALTRYLITCTKQTARKH